MKKIAALVLIVSFFFSCGEAPEKKNDQISNTKEKPQSSEPVKATPSADYSSLLLNYECDMTAAEVAQVLNIPEADVSLIETKLPRCDFEIRGFGKNSLGGTAMIWGAESFSKADSKKEIESALKEKENNESILGMDIELSETGDCYIRILPHVGRVLIYNENYDAAFYFDYSQRGIYKRTKEQHEELTKKTVALANYLLKKHRK